jgi:hypothetical protein
MTTGTRKSESGTGAPATAGRPLGAILASLPLADRIRLADTGDTCPTGWTGDDDWMREEYVRARALGDTARVAELVARMAGQDETTTTPPRDAHPSHTESTLGTVQDQTKPEPPVTPKPKVDYKGGRVRHIKFHDETFRAAAQKASEQGVTISSVLNRLLREWLES